MDQTLAKKLFEECAFFIVLGVPVGTEFGIDLKSWNTDKKFKGMKMIPPGLHYIFYSAVSDTGDVAPRSGFFHTFSKGEVILKTWDSDRGDISEQVVNKEEINKFKQNIKQLDNFLGPYPYDIYEKWITLTENITENLVNHLIPLSGTVRSVLELEGCSDADRPRLDKDGVLTSPVKYKKQLRISGTFNENRENEFLPQMKARSGTELRCTIFPERHYPEGSTPSDITQHSLDSSYILENVISKYDTPRDIIGELEFCFICFLIGHSLDAFEQWKKLVNVFCSCELAITKHRRIYDLFLKVLKLQIVEIPEEFLADIVTNSNFLYVKVRDLFRNIQNSNVDGQLKCKMGRFKDFLKKKYSWDFEHLYSDDEDDAPVVVDISEVNIASTN
ncbi:hypothetical protein WA026_003886 [Henosepilachna vigintioctopunctata]|uniref:Protein AAR2 homolog n=1 Tax=Henosepilachna vigintioctopunctata TaxID=420089 RepID=A0AAW1U5U9_9CUCU